MRLRPLRWLRRTPAPQGRHMRGVAPVTVPGAAATLVSAAAEPYLVPEPPTVDAVPPAAPPASRDEAEAPDPLTDGDPTQELHALAPAPTVTEGDSVPVGPAARAGAAVEEAEAGEAERPVLEPTVALGFADGGVLELAADDPRTAGFRDVAAAVLGHGAR